MIKLIYSLPDIKIVNAELMKIKCLFDCYKDDNSVLFWAQDSDRAVISMADGNMVIYNHNADIGELSEFISVLSPNSIFSDSNTLKALNLLTYEKVNVMHRKADITGITEGDILKSNEIYDLLNVEGLSLPDYPDFAVDYCRRLNSGLADYFGIKNKCAAISFNCGDYAILNGIASHDKGYGTIALKAIMEKNFGKEFLICCRDSVKEFYDKNGFKKLYCAGYWVK